MKELQNCHDCAVEPGQLHKPGCDVERCPLCGEQMLSCYCIEDMVSDQIEALVTAEHEKLVRLPWTGQWPGNDECEEFGWYSRMTPDAGWVRCSKDTPGAIPDLNRLAIDAKWDQKQRRYVRRG